MVYTEVLFLSHTLLEGATGVLLCYNPSGNKLKLEHDGRVVSHYLGASLLSISALTGVPLARGLSKDLCTIASIAVPIVIYQSLASGISVRISMRTQQPHMGVMGILHGCFAVAFGVLGYRAIMR